MDVPTITVFVPAIVMDVPAITVGVPIITAGVPPSPILHNYILADVHFSRMRQRQRVG